MSSSNAIKFGSKHQRFEHSSLSTLCKSIAISGLVLLLFYTFLYNHPHDHSSDLSMPNELKFPASTSPNITNSPTNISHVMFVIVGCLKTWKYRKAYVDAWWRENVTRGYLFLDEAPTEEFLPWPSSFPTFRVNEDVKKLKVYPKLTDPIHVRIYRSVLETFRLGDNKDVRWYVILDDDTLTFVDNLVDVLSKYDHTKYHYIGTNSECIKSNVDFSFDMGFGGAGYVLSYSMVEALAPKIDACIDRHPHLYSDHLSSSCAADMGVDLTLNKGIHQIDLVGDISGFLSAHPQSPLLTLHHFDTVDPIFPSMNRTESINHLMKAAKVDQSRLLQQTICYHRQSSWSFSISWGYSAYIYENTIPRSILKRPFETFKPWKDTNPPFFMFNTRWPSNDPCEAPHVFFMDSIENTKGNQVLTIYIRASPRNLPPCSSSGNHSADPISKIQVFLPEITRKEAGRIECCDVDYVAGMNTANVKIRACVNDEMIA